MKSIMKTLSIIATVGFLIYASGCNYNKVSNIKSNATNVLETAGFSIVGYEGYQIGNIICPGGKVWYVFKKKNYNDVLYHGYISKWGDEYHIYDLRAIDAIRPN